MWYYYDSMNSINLNEARYLVGRIQDYLRPTVTPKITDAVCSQQDNNYDCGAYIMAYAQEIVRRLAGNSKKREKVDRCILDSNPSNLLRKKIKDMINTKKQGGDRNKAKREESTGKSKMKPEDEEVSKEGKAVYDKDQRDPKNFPNLNKDKLCYFLTKGKCEYGAKGENHLGKCIKYHPDQC